MLFPFGIYVDLFVPVFAYTPGSKRKIFFESGVKIIHIFKAAFDRNLFKWRIGILHHYQARFKALGIDVRSECLARVFPEQPAYIFVAQIQLTGYFCYVYFF